MIIKFSYYGMNNELKWLNPNLNNKRHWCNDKKSLSIIENMTCDAPQGSCLGLLLSLSCMNDMPYPLKCSNTTMYAFDTSLEYSAKIFVI